ncbi:hypothetical protein [Fulvivirga sedimenti]|uniref:FecR protein domain-containing protein n=1 Tax=Fulvivirga sedimenti TaxID=2879465 RepID=A0A9X1HTN2_9BACT|nr:hypothetical protein [Fulvivirga sedimenti]MCA6075586.1 hypothetical protein [Fulvivirga sedimenti]MCA6076763.1 hypothetical protein [Fulvivirga sedimenti]MCA6077891.1 hypothetical protein [Fulvivirga sedimenti]
MKRLLILAILLSSAFAYGQRKQEIIVTMKCGDQYEITDRLSKFKGSLVLPEDNRKYIIGRADGERVKLPKSDIVSIRIAEDEEYLSLIDLRNNRHTIGTMLASGKVNVFKSYEEEVQQTGPNTPVISIREIYFEVTPEGLVRINPKKYIKTLANSCSTLDMYLRETGKIRRNDVDVLLERVNAMCSEGLASSQPAYRQVGSQ